MTYLLSFRLTLPLMFFVMISQSAVAGLIRDTELETGLQELAAPLVKAAGFAPNSIDFRIIIDSSYNAFSPHYRTFLCICDQMKICFV